jgi:hypothetical protein
MTIDVGKADVAKLHASMDKLRREMGLSLPDSLRWAVVAIGRSIAASTKVAPKRRKVELVTAEYDRFTKRGALAKTRRKVKIWGAYRWWRGQEDWRPFRDQPRNKSEANRHPSAQINMRGLAKAAWWWTGKRAGGMGGGAPAGTKATRRAHEMMIYDERLQGVNPSLLIGSKLGYARAALQNGPRDVTTAIDRASRALLHRMRETLKRSGAK